MIGNPVFDFVDSIEAYYQQQREAAGIFADCIEAKETWWEYQKMEAAEAADDVAEENIPTEVFDLKELWT